MSTQSIITDIIAKQLLLSPHDIQSKDSLHDLGLDSMMLVDVIFSIEEAFDIHIPFNANNTVTPPSFDTSSIDALARAVDMLIKEQS